MNNVFDKFGWMKGYVTPYLVDRNGKISKVGGKCNTVLSSGSKIVARLVAGEQNYRPTHIAFLTASGDGAVDASLNWNSLVAGGSYFLAPILAPTVNGNKTTFTTHLGLVEGTTPGENTSLGRAVLVSKPSPGVIEPFAAVNFDTPYTYTSDGLYLGLYWTLIFETAIQPATEQPVVE